MKRHTENIGGYDMADKKEPDVQEKKLSRRNFLKNAGLTVGGLAVGTGIGSVLVGGSKDKEVIKEVQSHSTNFNKALMFFTQEQFQTVEAATERIFPKTEKGPGAKELLVAYYIDHQLTSSWGLNTKEYMQGPFYEKEAAGKFGHQTHLTRKDIFTLGINLLGTEALKRHEKKFHLLDAEQQIEILKAVEANEVTMNAATTPSYFFKLLRSSTLEGAYADPLYGGNKDMAGWKMKNFPGHQMSYLDIIEKDEFIKIEPQSLTSQHKH